MSLSHPPSEMGFGRALWLCLAGFLTVLAFCAGWLSPKRSVPGPLLNATLPTQMIRTLLHLDSHMGRSLLQQGIPMLQRESGEGDPDSTQQVKPMELFLAWAVDMRYLSPQEVLRAQLPITEWRSHQQDPLFLKPEKHHGLRQPALILPDPTPKYTSDGKPQVLVFHTHTSESYLPVSGLEHALNKQGDIVNVGQFFTNTLESLGVPTLYNDTIHDEYPFRDSYKRSQVTVAHLLEENPSVRIVLDVHRDATPGLPQQVKVNGQPAAGIIFVVGSDKMGLPHPQWQKNYQFALDLADALDRRYPGMVLRVIRSNARYNQHLHDHAIIVEVGNQKSTLEEAKLSVECLAKVLKDYLEEHPSSRTGSQNPSSAEDSE